MDIRNAIAKVVERQNLTGEEMMTVMTQVMTGQATPAQIGGFLIALRMKGETVAEITAAARVMRQLSTKVELNQDHVVDTCGTGGDGSKLFNVSTASAFVVAAAGGKVAKHGGRSVSSKSGSADLLEQAGIYLGLSAEEVSRCVEEIGLGFMFAPNHHSAMRHAVGPRKEMATRTLFNLLGPLTNPAGAKAQVMGVFGKQWVRPIAEVLKELGSEHVMVVHSEDGLDEISIAAPTFVAELKDGEITEYTITPEQFNLELQSLEPIMAFNAEESLVLVKSALEGKGKVNPARDIVALNAGAAIYVSGVADTLAEGVAIAEDVIGGGLAKVKLSELASFTRCFKKVEK
ncbi:anthranilate phosphoribosyltransferase [Marinomonas mediterranea]|uniref:Anthranilate phosphoribosyltransferase n=1 Tax=Marinomonas mediterranea (strain ATCC 700492 / JCM 21426 / NBRC 103028 / MMB-1) TaxID=717774 RepID=F2JT85_MARM1|nr:anthranilate phosphoribosyltransferase [Marinomonas mediterranea]ADZ90303.1 Anthranilate phosphoribosyltransferase [Marinomonas mediterranea MMB-1]WCN08363.1 anthranilate phosphoribosyltransferase [Marinomonas mediterranea]WCN12419.1 anthranilate phosphoribosyltransferase [Marinomonas mediterranea]WCN16492.1 anthranilate phosphoribosyltransferase [Marinomonas mediterranea MMB-1]